MSIREADIKKGWTEMEAIAGKCFAVPPKVDPNHESDLSDFFEWGQKMIHVVMGFISQR